MSKLRRWLIKTLAGRDSVMINVRVIGQEEGRAKIFLQKVNPVCSPLIWGCEFRSLELGKCSDFMTEAMSHVFRKGIKNYKEEEVS